MTETKNPVVQPTEAEMAVKNRAAQASNVCIFASIFVIMLGVAAFGILLSFNSLNHLLQSGSVVFLILGVGLAAIATSVGIDWLFKYKHAAETVRRLQSDS